MFKLTNLLILFLASTFVFSKDVSKASTYSWYGLKVKLPFPNEWLVNQAKRKDKKDPLVFFEPNTSPRIAAGLYHTNYDLDPVDYSAFREGFLKEKKAWLKKQSAELVGEIVLKAPKSRGGAFRYEMTFKRLEGSFREIGLFMKCRQGPQEKSFTLKAMLPETRWQSPKAKEILTFFSSASPCP